MNSVITYMTRSTPALSLLLVRPARLRAQRRPGRPPKGASFDAGRSRLAAGAQERPRNLEKMKSGLAALQILEITQNHQGNAWKSLEKKSSNLGIPDKKGPKSLQPKRRRPNPLARAGEAAAHRSVSFNSMRLLRANASSSVPLSIG